MSIKGGKIDASGEFIKSFRIVTDIDADAGLGTPTDPLRVDPTGTTVQPVSFSAPQHVIVDSGGGGGTQYTDGSTQATPTGTVALGKDPSNVVKSLPLTAAGALKVDNSAVTQPVSGTVTANAGSGTFAISAASLPLPTGAALDATLTGGTQQTKITDGTNVATVKAASTAAIATDKAVVVAVSPNNTIAATQSGTWTVQPGNTANTTAWKVDGSAVTQPVSGTVTDRLTGNAGAILDAAVTAATAPANGVAVLSQFNTTAPAPTAAQTMALQSDAKGNVLISPEGRKATYRVANSNANSVNGLSVLVRGSATKTVKITRIHITVSAATAALVSIFLAKGTGGATGGTVSNNLLVSNVCNSDSADGATTLNALAEYSAAFTNTTPAGFPASQVVLAPSATVAGNGLIEWQFGGMGAKPLTLRGINELIGIQFNAVVNYNFEMEWTEE
jgi:hypothetical protein